MYPVKGLEKANLLSSKLLIFYMNSKSWIFQTMKEQEYKNIYLKTIGKR